MRRGLGRRIHISQRIDDILHDVGCRAEHEVAAGDGAGRAEVVTDVPRALGRLLHWLHGLPLRRVLVWIAGPFVVADAISLIDPEAFYNKLLKPSLGALFISQLLVFLVFPLFRRGVRWLPLVAVASGLAVWGFYTLVSGSAST